eukprot:1160786-Pelagomonas_calceolata.AAC.18
MDKNAIEDAQSPLSEEAEDRPQPPTSLPMVPNNMKSRCAQVGSNQLETKGSRVSAPIIHNHNKSLHSRT